MDVPHQDRRTTVGWLTVGIVIFGLVLFVVLSLVGAVLVGLFVYYATRPAYRWLSKRLDHPDVNATITLLLVGLPMLFVLGYGAIVGLRQLDLFLAAASLEEFRPLLQPYLDLVRSPSVDAFVAVVSGNLGRIRWFVTSAATWLLRIFVALSVAFYLLRDDDRIAAWFRETFADEPEVVDFVEGVDDDLTTIYTGNLITIAATAAVAVAVFYALNFLAPAGAGVAFPLLLGLVIGVATLIPAVGMKIVYVPYTGLLLWRAQGPGGGPLWFPVVFFLVTFLVVDSFPDIFVRAYLSKGRYNMGLVMLSYVFAAVAFGWYGVFLAPVLLTAFVHYSRDVLPAMVRHG